MAESENQAKRFFADRIIHQAICEGTPLSYAERRMLSWSETDPEFRADSQLVAGLAAEISDDEFEAKISGLLQRAFQADRGVDPRVRDRWRRALAVLKQGDHYISILRRHRAEYHQACCLRTTMDFFDLMAISHRDMELLNPSTPEKMLKLGKMLGMKEGARVIDYGSGCGEPLALWGKEYGITGVGVDISADFCQRASKKLQAEGLSDRIEIVCGKGADYPLPERPFDVATCIGATFVFGGYRETVQALKRAVHSKGRLGIGDVYWASDTVPPEYAQRELNALTETELLRVTREEGFEVEYVIRASRDDWDRYYSDNWSALLRWLDENPSHPDRQQVFEYFRHSQDEYSRYERPYLGWAMYVLKPGMGHATP